MNKKLLKNNSLMKIIYNSLINLPTPMNLNSWWNFGSILGLCLIIQIISGIILSMHYTANIYMAFESINHITRDVTYGWIMRTVHSNGASMFFICLYIHTGRGIYYSSYKMWSTWTVGVMLLLMIMATAFLGYVLPWGQMSFWGATVITNLMSAIPYLGNYLVNWIWGGFAVENSTLTRFFSLHFTLPFIILMMVMIHLFFLHQTGSSNPTGLKSNLDKIPFNPFYSIKDIMGFSIFLTMFVMLTLMEPFMLADPDNFNPANQMVTPIHIQPEWYFLFAYSILRAIPNKLGGVLALVSSIMILFTMPIVMKIKFKGNQFYPMNQVMFWMFVNTIMLLTWVGMKPVEEPFINMGFMLTIIYFMYFIVNPMLTKFWEKMIL